jgi:hypothetical protein
MRVGLSVACLACLALYSELLAEHWYSVVGLNCHLKQLMYVFSFLYLYLQYTVKSKSSPEDMKEMWEALQESKIRALDMLEAENDGYTSLQ